MAKGVDAALFCETSSVFCAAGYVHNGLNRRRESRNFARLEAVFPMSQAL